MSARQLLAEVRRQQEAETKGVEALVRLHFRETPLALASIQRTGVCPWPIEVVRTQGRIEVTGQGRQYRVRATVKVVEHERLRPLKPMAPCTMEPALPDVTVLDCGKPLDHQGHRWTSAASGHTFGCTGQR